MRNFRSDWTGRICAGATALGLALGAQAAGDGFREHEAHEHGHGALDLVVDGGELVIELRIPGVNVVGFEHEATTDAQRQAVDDALAVFSRASALFVPSDAARCEVESVAVELGGHQSHVGEHDEHDADGHDGEHDARHEEGHDADEKTHNELVGTYQFHCDAPGALERVEVRVFEHLRDAEELEARVVTPTLQTAVELEPGDAAISLAP